MDFQNDGVSRLGDKTCAGQDSSQGCTFENLLHVTVSDGNI
jgi:hypothetical protein